MNQAWQTHRERGSVFFIKLITWLSLSLGRRLGHILLYPVCVYFIIFSRGGRRASRQYLDRVLGRPAGWKDIFLHHYYFAATLLDRAFLLVGKDADFDINSHGLDAMLKVIDAGSGGLLLGAHLGSFEMTRNLGVKFRDVKVNMMMYQDNAQKINQVIESLGGRQRMRVIPIGTVDALIKAKARVDKGELISILGDRAAMNDKLVHAPFFGQSAVFPAGPFLVASALKIPVVIFFCVYEGGNRYTEYFELFAQEIVINRKNRQADLEKWAQRYAQRLEYYCRLAPYNWFNFFDFWGNASAQASSVIPTTE